MIASILGSHGGRVSNASTTATCRSRPRTCSQQDRALRAQRQRTAERSLQSASTACASSSSGWAFRATSAARCRRGFRRRGRSGRRRSRLSRRSRRSRSTATTRALVCMPDEPKVAILELSARQRQARAGREAAVGRPRRATSTSSRRWRGATARSATPPTITASSRTSCACAT